jgi:hypothetical protein
LHDYHRIEIFSYFLLIEEEEEEEEVTDGKVGRF